MLWFRSGVLPSVSICSEARLLEGDWILGVLSSYVRSCLGQFAGYVCCLEVGFGQKKQVTEGVT